MCPNSISGMTDSHFGGSSLILPFSRCWSDAITFLCVYLDISSNIPEDRLADDTMSRKNVTGLSGCMHQECLFSRAYSLSPGLPTVRRLFCAVTKWRIIFGRIVSSFVDIYKFPYKRIYVRETVHEQDFWLHLIRKRD